MADLLKMAGIFVNKIKKDYADDVAIAAYYGSYAKGTQHSKSDLDIFFIPATDKGWNLADCFILDDIGIDLFPISWERAEKIASFNETIVSVIADCEILYSRSHADLTRFNLLRDYIKLQSSPEKKEDMVSKAADKFERCFVSLYNMERQTELTSNRIEAFNIMTTIFEVLALLNQTYLKAGWGKNSAQISAFKIKPANLEELVSSIITEESGMAESCKNLIKAVKNTLIQEQNALNKKASFESLFNGYFEEMKSTFNKIVAACENKDYETAFYSSAALQNEIASFLAKAEGSLEPSNLTAFNDIRKVYDQFGFPDLLANFQHENLTLLKMSVIDLEKKLVGVLQNNHVEIKHFATLDEYENYLNTAK